MKRIIIFGCGGFGREVLQIVLDLKAAGEAVEPVAFMVSQDHEAPERVHGLPVLKGFDAAGAHADVEFVVAVGATSVRKRTADALTLRSAAFATLVHPSAWIGRGISLGAGTIVCPHVSITTDIDIGKHCHLNLNTTVGHDVVISDYTTVNPGVNISGGACIGVGCELGAGSVILPKARLGEWCTIGAGAVVTRNMPALTVCVGVPARPIRQKLPDDEM